MRIHLLTYASPERPSATTKVELDMLQEAAQKLGHTLEIIYSRECQLKFDKKPQLFIQNKKLPKIDILLVRANFLENDPEYHTSIIRQFVMSGVRVINDHNAVARAKNKVRTMQILSRFKIPIPKTYMVRSAEYIDDIIEDIGSLPVILKTTSGSHGAGVSIVESKRGLRSIIQMMMKNEQSAPLMIQEYIKESQGKDIRVFIVGKRIVAAMERIATKKGEFRSNFKLGGRVRVAELSEREKKAAFAAVKACNLDIAGVDILRTKNGPKILEVNSNPGLEGITLATGRDIAGEVIKYCVKKAKMARNT